MAPVFPAETTTAASPSATARQARNIELSRFSRTASDGLSSMATTCSAWTISSPSASGSSTSRGP